jgi:hypothetical protein
LPYFPYNNAVDWFNSPDFLSNVMRNYPTWNANDIGSNPNGTLEIRIIPKSKQGTFPCLSSNFSPKDSAFTLASQALTAIALISLILQ